MADVYRIFSAGMSPYSVKALLFSLQSHSASMDFLVFDPI
jgi:hypothetical protein